MHTEHRVPMAMSPTSPPPTLLFTPKQIFFPRKLLSSSKIHHLYCVSQASSDSLFFLKTKPKLTSIAQLLRPLSSSSLPSFNRSPPPLILSFFSWKLSSLQHQPSPSFTKFHLLRYSHDSPPLASPLQHCQLSIVPFD